MADIDYSNMGLFNKNTTKPDAKEKNAELKAMYRYLRLYAFRRHHSSKKCNCVRNVSADGRVRNRRRCAQLAVGVES